MNAHVISPSLKDFVRYQVGSAMSLLRKVLPQLCPFSANSIVVLLNRNESCRLCSRWDWCRKLFCAHLGVASCGAFLYLSGVWCWELSSTGTSWAFQLKTDHPVLLTMVPHHLLGNKTLSLRDVVKSCDTQKVLHGVTSSVQTLHCTQQKRRVPFQQKAWMFVWVTCRNRGWFGKSNFLIKTILELWADEHFGSFAAVGLFPLTSDDISNSLWTALGFPVLQLCCLL